MARAASTYRGARRDEWRSDRRTNDLWSAHTRAPYGKLSTGTVARQEAAAIERAEKQLKAYKDWVLAISAKVHKRLCLSNRELVTFMMGPEASP